MNKNLIVASWCALCRQKSYLRGHKMELNFELKNLIVASCCVLCRQKSYLCRHTLALNFELVISNYLSLVVLVAENWFKIQRHPRTILRHQCDIKIQHKMKPVESFIYKHGLLMRPPENFCVFKLENWQPIWH